MARYIDVDEFAEAICKFPAIDENSANAVISLLRGQPTADVAPVKHGVWEEKDHSGISVNGYMACSVCNAMIPRCEDNYYCLHRLNYCPNCGAKMDGGAE